MQRVTSKGLVRPCRVRETCRRARLVGHGPDDDAAGIAGGLAVALAGQARQIRQRGLN